MFASGLQRTGFRYERRRNPRLGVAGPIYPKGVAGGVRADRRAICRPGLYHLFPRPARPPPRRGFDPGRVPGPGPKGPLPAPRGRPSRMALPNGPARGAECKKTGGPSQNSRAQGGRNDPTDFTNRTGLGGHVALAERRPGKAERERPRRHPAALLPAEDAGRSRRLDGRQRGCRTNAGLPRRREAAVLLPPQGPDDGPRRGGYAADGQRRAGRPAGLRPGGRRRRLRNGGQGGPGRRRRGRIGPRNHARLVDGQAENGSRGGGRDAASSHCRAGNVPCRRRAEGTRPPHAGRQRACQ